MAAKNLTDIAINETANEANIDMKSRPHKNLDLVRLSYEWIFAQLANGNRDGRNGLRKHTIEKWVGHYISSTDVEIAMHIAGITGLARKPIFPNVSRLGYPAAGQQSNYADKLHRDTSAQDEYVGAESDANGKEVSLPEAFKQHSEFMCRKKDGKND